MYVLQGMGTVASSDFRVLECPTGELLLENPAHTGQYVSIWSSKYRINVQEFSVYLLVRNLICYCASSIFSLHIDRMCRVILAS